MKLFRSLTALLVGPVLAASLGGCGSPKGKFTLQQNLGALKAAEHLETLTHEDPAIVDAPFGDQAEANRLAPLLTTRAFQTFHAGTQKTQLGLIPQFTTNVTLDPSRPIVRTALTEFRVTETKLREPGGGRGLSVSWEGAFTYPVKAAGKAYTIEFSRKMRYDLYLDPRTHAWLLDSWVSSFNSLPAKESLLAPSSAPPSLPAQPSAPPAHQ